MPYISESEYSLLLSSLEQKSDLLQNNSETIATLTALLKEAGEALEPFAQKYEGAHPEHRHTWVYEYERRAAEIRKRIQEALP